MENKKHNTNSQSMLLYNTQNIDSELLKLGFSIRKKEYQRIWKDIKTGTMERPETHYLIQGVRGAGKTTLLSRLAYEVTDNTDLNNWLIPILLNEEEYGILSLFTFWLRIAEKLADYNAEKYIPLYQRLLDLENDDSGVAWELIRHYLDENGQKIIVFVDNLGELFQDFDDIEHAQLREALSLHPQIRLVGGSSQLLEAHYDGNAPFYQFFKLINLKSISEEEMHELLRSLAKQTSDEAVTTIEDIITNHAERIEAVRRLTDGVPRTIVLLFQIIMEGAKESSYAYLEETIDKTTPLYKHRMDDLPRQQKAIVHAIAMNWDAMSTKEIAEQTRLPSKTVSAQLVKLQKQWIIDKVETDTKNHLYIIKERFFNIWYLMRYGRESDKRRVLWLTRFLESWCNEEELIDRLFEIDNLIVSSKIMVSQDYINALLSTDKMPVTFKLHYSEKFKKPYPETVNINIQSYTYIDLADEIVNSVYNNQIYRAVDIAISQLYSNDIDNILFSGTFVQKVIKYKSMADKLFAHAEALVEQKGCNSDDVFKVINWYYLTALNERKLKALHLISSVGEVDLDNVIKIHLAIIQLWNNLYEESVVTITGLEDITSIDTFNPIDEYFLLLLSKFQVETTYNLILKLNLKEELKPFYYATVSLLKDERHQEYLRMGSELKDTVDEILQKVEDYRIKYS